MSVSSTALALLIAWPIVAFVVGVLVGKSIRLRDRIGR